jgi:hypothetical protein
MSVLIVLLLAVLSRILPHALHQVAWNFSFLGGGLLFIGSRLKSDSARSAGWKIAGVLAVLMATDYYLTVYAYGYAFHVVASYVVMWAWYVAICVLGMGLFRRVTAVRVAAGAIAAPTSFFLLSNFAVWAGSAMYPHSLAGLGTCYAAAVPFYRNDLVSTAITAGALFGLPALATRIAQSLHAADSNLAA